MSFYEVIPFEEGHILPPELETIKSSILRCQDTLGEWVSYESEGLLNGAETLVLNIRVSVPTRSPFGILKSEKVGISLSESRRTVFKASSLRKNFPDLPHMNLTPKDAPREFCLSDIPFMDGMYNETLIGFVIRVKSWLDRAAIGELHLDEQGMEPFIMGTVGDFVFDSETEERITNTNSGFELQPVFCLRPDKKNKKHYIEVRSRDIGRKGPRTPFVILCVKSYPTSNQCINYTPTHYFELSELLKQKLSIDLDQEISNFISTSYGRKEGFPLYQDKHPLIVICIPRLNAAGVLIGNEIVVFHVQRELKDIGKAIGCIREKHLAKEKRRIYVLQNEISRDADELKKIRVFPFSAVRSLSNKLATDMADIATDVSQKSFSVIGLGALGSQVVLNLARQGFSNWKLVDSDILLPHNFARHGLSAFYRGMSKAVALKQEIDLLLEDPRTKAIYREFDHLTDKESKLVFDVDCTLDCSASYSVFLDLAYREQIGPRTLSAYYCGAGFTSILLVESSDRSIRLDDLDLQLKIQGLENPIIRNIYRTSERNPLVYSTSCASRTTVLPQDLVSVHAGILAAQIKDVINYEGGKAFVNLISDSGYGIQVESYTPCKVVVESNGSWQFRISRSVLDEMNEYRNHKLPNETGGVLIGWINSFTRTIYVGRALPAPPDSEERPYSFTRGKKGLYVKVEEIKRISNEDIYYVGEWHTHPSGSSVFLSGDDLRSMQRLSDIMLEVGLPGVMLIIGDHDELGCYIKSGWEE